MKNNGLALVLAVIAFFAVVISSCGTHKTPASPVVLQTPSPCATFSVNYSPLAYTSALAAGDYIISSEAVYLANYAGFAAAGSPTPTPVPVDFTLKTVIGVMRTGGCQAPSRALTGITDNCNSVGINISSTNSFCPGGPMCYAIMVPFTQWVVMDKTSLPVIANSTFIDRCYGTTTTSTDIFGVPTPVPPNLIYPTPAPGTWVVRPTPSPTLIP